MKGNFNHKCLNERVHEKYYIDIIAGKPVVKAQDMEAVRLVCPFDDAVSLVLKYLEIGFNTDNGDDASEQILEFVSSYGLLKRNAEYVDINDFSEDAQALYLHFKEISEADYPENPEWILETENQKAIIKREEKSAYIEWQTKSLSAAIELAYTLLICGNDRYIGICKHCGRPFKIINPKTEFCSFSCRNRFNVYKSRAKNK